MRIPTLGIRAFDTLGAAALAAFTVAGTFGAAQDQPDRADVDALAIALLVAGAMALVLMRAHPRAGVVAVTAASLVYLALGYPYGPVFFPLTIALALAVVQGERTAGWISAAVLYAGHAIAALVRGDDWWDPVALGGLAAWLVAALAVGEVIRARRERMAEHARARAIEERRVAGEERLRIARDLHDVLAHNITLINVQAGVALHVMDRRPEQARTALTAIRDASADALAEVRVALDTLRGRDEEAPRAPAATLARLDDLIDDVRAAGLPVEVAVRGERRTLPVKVDQAAYRIVQESLTNVRRHAGAARAAVELGYAADALTVTVEDDGRGPLAADAGGSGLTGMRERAAALGGRLDAGPAPGRGFRVRAVLPLGPPA